jgi:hypothetical protein
LFRNIGADDARYRSPLTGQYRGKFAGTKMRTCFYRFAASVFALALFLSISFLYWYGHRDLYERVLTLYGATPFHFPFLDISQWLAVWECARQGVDVIPSNPCDVLQRPFGSSPLWIAASGIPLGVSDTPVVGWILDLLFIAALSVLPPPRRPLELALVLAATLSTTVVFALERANPDVMLFLLALLTGYFAKGRAFVRLLGYSVALTSALLKYYPVMVLIIVFRERRKVLFLSVLLTIFASLASFLAMYHVELARGLPNIDHGPYNTGFFAAKNLPFLLGEAAGSAAGPSSWAPLAQHIIACGLFAILVGISVAICRKLLSFGELRAALGSLAPLERVFLVIGSAVITGCFFAGQSVGYRGVYFLLAMPGLLAISRRPAGRDLRTLALGTGVVIVLLMWSECFRFALHRALGHPGIPETLAVYLAFLFWLFRELGWWWTVSVMLPVLVDFLSASPITHWVSSLFYRSAVVVR